jgi:hypothetical protein
MNENLMTQAVIDQFQRALTMFRDAVAAFSPESWRAGEPDYARPAGVAYHVVETLDFYVSDQPVDAFAWGERFGVDWESPDSDSLPAQAQVLAYLEEVEPALMTWLEGTDLASSEDVYPWTGPAKLGRAIYVLRNTQHHVAEMNLELVRRGHNHVEWR